MGDRQGGCHFVLKRKEILILRAIVSGAVITRIMKNGRMTQKGPLTNRVICLYY
jgi:hypothetical protein